MRGSILVTFDELINDRGVDNWQLEIGPGANQLRNVHFTDCNNLYSTFVFTGNTVTFLIAHTDEFRGAVDITRIDYTTDDEGGDLGIKETIITPTIVTGTTFYVASFTASTVVSAYNFKYVINARTNPAPTPTPTPTPPGPTPTPTPPPCDYYKIYNNAVINRPFGPFTVYTYIQCDGEPFGKTISVSGSGTIPISGLTYFECVSGGTVPVTVSTFTAELLDEPCPEPTPTPTPEVCGLPLRAVNWEIDYSYVSDLSSGFTVAQVTLLSRPTSGVCPNSLFGPVSYFNTSTYVDYTGLTNGTVWSATTNVSGQTDTTRDINVTLNICYEPSSYPTIVRSGTTVKLYINDVFIKNYDNWSGGGPYENAMVKCSELSDYTKISVTFNDVTINENDDVKILFEDNFITPWQKNQFEYNWDDSSAFTRFVTGYTFGGDHYIPEFTQTLTGYSGTYLTTLYTTSTKDLTGAQVYFRLSNSGTTDTVNTRTVKLFQNSIEQTGFTVTQTGMTIPLSPSGLTRLYTSWPTTDNDPLINNLWQINDTFVVVPSPTPTPTITPTPTPTPTPLPATMQYRYIGTSTISGTTKTASTLRVNINSNFVHSGSSVNFTTSTDTTSTATVINNDYVGIPVNIQGVRWLNRNITGGVSEFVTIRSITLYRNGSVVSTNDDPTNYTIPLAPSQRINTYTFTGITINPGDVMEIRWRDTIIT